MDAHARQCGSYKFTCIDCSVSFDRNSVKGHTTCVSEHEKYALGATKPGGYAEKGFQAPAAAGGATSGKGGDQPEGLEFLTSRPPWKCNLCNVNCTSQETLMGHAAGTKHIKRARAALRAKQGGDVGKAAQGAKEVAGERKEVEEKEKASSPSPSGTGDEGKGKKSGKKKADEVRSNAAVVFFLVSRTAACYMPALCVQQSKTQWKKVAKKILKAKGGPMKLSKLVKKALEEAGSEGAGEDEIVAKLRKSGKFNIEGDTISLS